MFSFFASRFCCKVIPAERLAIDEPFYRVFPIRQMVEEISPSYLGKRGSEMRMLYEIGG